MKSVKPTEPEFLNPDFDPDRLFWLSWSRSDKSKKRAFINNLVRVLSGMEQRETAASPKLLNWTNMTQLKNQISDPAINAFLKLLIVDYCEQAIESKFRTKIDKWTHKLTNSLNHHVG
ncbi:MAG: hypothetical protein ACLQT6_06980 [Desulfomonilaceae bacterium]